MDIKDLMRAAHEEKPTEFEAAFDELMMDRVNSVLTDRSSEIGQSIGMPAEAPETGE